MTEVDSDGDVEGLGFGTNDAMAAVMLQGDANVESVRAAKVPGAVSGWLIVGDDREAEWEERGGIVVKGPLKCSQADMLGVTEDWRRRLSVSSVCGRSRSQR